MKLPYFKILIFTCMSIFYACADSSKQKEATPTTTEKTEEPTKETQPKEKIVENTKPAFGIDISFYQGDEIDDLEKSRDSIDFIICKATQGISMIDPMFQKNWITIKEKGFIRGAYHFYVSTDDPVEQAEFFIERIQDIQPNDLPPVVDVEQGGIVGDSQTPTDIQQSVLKVLETIEEQLHIKPIIYTNTDFANAYLNNPELANYPLWIADYESQKEPVLPITWQEKGYALWQKSDTYKILNYTNDEDYFNGNLEGLKAFIDNSRK